MHITKAQSKQLRYACGAVDYNQPCTRKYTGTPEGKLREIGKFKYIENGSELKSFTFNGGAVNLDGIIFDVLLACVMEGDGLDPIPAVALPEPKKPSDIADAVALACVEPDMAVHLDAACGNDVHAVNVPVTVVAAEPVAPPADDWCTPENVGDWQEPDEMEKVLKAAEERRKVEGEPEKAPAVAPQPQLPKAESLVMREEFENALRETSMNAAAREALRILNLECGFDDAATILRTMATVPNFIGTYGKCLEKVGTPHTLVEIAAALPSQQGWLATLAINNWKIKD